MCGFDRASDAVKRIGCGAGKTGAKTRRPELFRVIALAIAAGAQEDAGDKNHCEDSANKEGIAHFNFLSALSLQAPATADSATARILPDWRRRGDGDRRQRPEAETGRGTNWGRALRG